MTGHPTSDHDLVVTEIACLRARIAELEQSERALRVAHDELADFVERAAVGLHWVGPDGTILWANQAELDLLGYTADEYVGRHIAEFHADRDVIDDILTRLARDETLHSYEARLRCKDGSIRHVMISSNVRRVDGDFIHTRCFTRDITARRLAELREIEVAQELAREQEEFLATAAHELKTPLTTIKATTQLLTRRLARADGDTDTLRSLGRQVEGQVARMETLVNELLDVSRLRAGGPDAQRTWSDLREHVLAAYAHASTSPERTDAHRLALEAAEMIHGWWDGPRLEQVVTNLLSNALKYSPAGGEVLVALQRDGAEAVLTVRDAGLGMSAETVSGLFRPFARGDAAASGIAGTGLGLYIAARVVARHAGTLTIDSTPDAGSTFTVRLPIPDNPHDQLATGRLDMGAAQV